MLNKGCAGAVFTEVLGRVKHELINKGMVYILGEQGTGKSLAATLACFDVIPETFPIVINCACNPPSVMCYYFNFMERLVARTTGCDVVRAFVLDGVECMFEHNMDKVEEMKGWVSSHDNLRVVLIVNGNGNNIHTIDSKHLSAICSKSNIEMVNIPPLRDRKEDIVPIAEFCIKEYCHHKSGNELRMAPELMDFLVMQPWSGNVWELKFAILYSLSSSKNGLIMVRDLPEQLSKAASFSEDQRLKGLLKVVFEKISSMGGSEQTFGDGLYKHIMDTVDSVLIPLALRHTGGNQTKAAKLLGISRNTFRKKFLGVKIP